MRSDLKLFSSSSTTSGPSECHQSRPPLPRVGCELMRVCVCFQIWISDVLRQDGNAHHSGGGVAVCDDPFSALG